MSLKLRYLFILLLFTGAAQTSYSQGLGRTPYSNFGLGEFTGETVAAQDMMGGTGVSFSNSFYNNHLNPALTGRGRVLGGLKYVGFNVSGTGYRRNLEQGNSLSKDLGGNLSNISLVFPVVPRWSVGVSYKPHTIVDHESRVIKNFAGSSSLATYTHANSGGLTKVGLTNSFMLAKGLNLGVEAQYFFGNITKDTTMFFIGATEGTMYRTRYDLKGVSLKGGLAYQQKISKKWYANIGGTYQMGSNVKGEMLNLFNASMLKDQYGVSSQVLHDTLSIGAHTAGLPSSYKIGVSLEKPWNWVFAAEYGVTDYEGISKPFDAISKSVLRNSTEMNFGIEWVPNANSTNYFDHIFYRVGYKTIEMPHLINNTRMKDNSFSFGVSLPMAFRSTNYIDIGLAVGRRGTVVNNLVEENYIKLSLSFSLMRDWFFKPRID